MKPHSPLLLTVALALGAVLPLARSAERTNFDADWRFALGHATDPTRDFNHGTRYFSDLAKAGFGDGPAAADFDDRTWRRLDLPHDWAVELPFDPRGTASHGFKALGRNFPENSIGWYRKTFRVPASDLGRRIAVEFDGVFRDAELWINGFRLDRAPSGYIGFRRDLTDYLNYGGDNVLAVRVNATEEEGWFYEGAGIYRHVWLTKSAPLHVVPWGTGIATTPGIHEADIAARTTVANEGTADTRFDLVQQVLDPDGKVVAEVSRPNQLLAAGATADFACDLEVAAPRLWSLDSPVLYRLVTTLLSGTTVIDRYETPFGIRSIHWDPDHGFFLNGQRVELKGVNLHQDHAGVGVAVPDALLPYRLAQLKAFGVNAIRCSHNPPAPEFLDACDRLGLLVIDENRRTGTTPEILGELAAMIRRDRNHPSVILWSLGNEEWSIEGNIKGARITSVMQAFAHRLDPTHRTTVAISGGWGGTSTVVDVVGYNYIHQSNPDQQHADYPQQPGVGTEETTTQATRGVYVDDRANCHLAPLEHGDSGGNCEIGWQYYAQRPFLAGLFYWTGFDYRGEPTPFGWPAIGAQMGLLDQCGFRKDSSYYLESWWTDHPVLHLATHWNWPGREGQPIKVVCYTNHDAVELLLNGTSLGRQNVPLNGHLEWSVPYAPGVLEARGYRQGQLAGTTRVETSGPAAAVIVTPDRPTVHADGTDVVVFNLAAQDARGRFVPVADNLLQFHVTGGRILGVGNGDPSSHEPDQFHETISFRPIAAWQGRIAPAGGAEPPALTGLSPLDQLGQWLAPRPKAGEVYELTGNFSLDTLASGTTVTLSLPTFGVRTTCWVNGHEVARDVDTTAAGVYVPLTAAQLVTGANRVQLRVTAFADSQNHIPETTQVGVVSLTAPAPVAQRRFFNGLAQIIVQVDRGARAVKLTATSTGLPAAESTVAAAP